VAAPTNIKTSNGKEEGDEGAFFDRGIIFFLFFRCCSFVDFVCAKKQAVLMLLAFVSDERRSSECR